MGLAVRESLALGSNLLHVAKLSHPRLRAGAHDRQMAGRPGPMTRGEPGTGLARGQTPNKASLVLQLSLGTLP